ncbi:hypothetical protein [Desulfobulbus propionicus]
MDRSCVCGEKPEEIEWIATTYKKTKLCLIKNKGGCETGNLAFAALDETKKSKGRVGKKSNYTNRTKNGESKPISCEPLPGP